MCEKMVDETYLECLKFKSNENLEVLFFPPSRLKRGESARNFYSDNKKETELKQQEEN